MWPFAKKPLLAQEDSNAIVEAIQQAEKQTSGELRVYMERHCKYVLAIDRAKEIFDNLQMSATKDRNGVLLYFALKDKQLGIYADEGIHKAVGKEYWEKTVSDAIAVLKEDNLTEGIIKCIEYIGEALKTNFPYDGEMDKNELPDDVIFGR